MMICHLINQTLRYYALAQIQFMKEYIAIKKRVKWVIRIMSYDRAYFEERLARQYGRPWHRFSLFDKILIKELIVNGSHISNFA